MKHEKRHQRRRALPCSHGIETCVLRAKAVNGKKLYESVRTVGFGEGASPLPRHGMTVLSQRVTNAAAMYVYANRRAEMYGLLRNLIKPEVNPRGFGLLSAVMNAKRQDGEPSLRE